MKINLNLKSKDIIWKSKELFKLHPLDLINQIDLIQSKVENYMGQFKQVEKDGTSQLLPGMIVSWEIAKAYCEEQFGKWAHNFNSNLRNKIKEYQSTDKIENVTLFKKFANVYMYSISTVLICREIISFEKTNRKTFDAIKSIEEKKAIIKKEIE